MTDGFHAWWVKAADAGIIKERLYSMLQRIFDFDKWHTGPVNFRPYAQDIIDSVNEYVADSDKGKNNAVIEVGCGLGDIIGNIRYRRRLGYDIEENVLRAGRLLHYGVEFRTGSFREIKNEHIKCMIMVNFVHEISEEELADYVKELMEDNYIEMFVMDSLRGIEGTEYKYGHDTNRLFASNYECVKTSRGYGAASGARRVIEYWKLKETEGKSDV